MTDFLPKGYVPPETEKRFLELEEGPNTIRVLSRAIVGYKWWIEADDGARVPRRVRGEDEVPLEVRQVADGRDRAKHFWAFVVYNYEARAVQVLEIKQQTIMRSIEALLDNPKWGDPRNFDLVIEKVKTGPRDWDVEYHVYPEPPAPLDPGIEELARNTTVRLEALYDGEDPFTAAAKEEREDEADGRNGRDKTHAGDRGRIYS